MIFDLLANAARYAGLGKRFRDGLAALRDFNVTTPEGRRELRPDGALFALVQRYETKPAAGKTFESHRRYADIQYVLAGEEWIYWRPTGTLEVTSAYQAERDTALYAMVEPVVRLHATPGTFGIFFPDDGHAPGIAFAAPATVQKIVLKVLLD